MKLNSYVCEEDGSIIDVNGNYLFVSYDKFINEVVRGECCFLCCSTSDKKEFNDEHIIPRWVLKRFDLYKSFITLKNFKKVRYDKYTLTCCAECNHFLGNDIETEISKATKDGLEGLLDYVEKHSTKKIFLWLSLVFIKTHLKDAQQRWHLDQRKGNTKLDIETDWGSIHHIYCVVRSLQNQVYLNKDCIGTIMIMEAEQGGGNHKYDFADSPSSNTIFVKLGDIALFGVLDDSTGAAHFIEPLISKLSKPITWPQSREIFSHLCYLNIMLKERPTYSTVYSLGNSRFEIIAKLPKSLYREEHDPEFFGHIMYSNFNHLDLGEEVKENILAGKYTYLSD